MKTFGIVALALLIIGCGEKEPKSVDSDSTVFNPSDWKIRQQRTYSAPDTALTLEVSWMNDTTVMLSTYPGPTNYINAVNHWSQFDAELIEVDCDMIPARQYEFSYKECGGMLKISLDSTYALYTPNEGCGKDQLYIRDTI